MHVAGTAGSTGRVSLRRSHLDSVMLGNVTVPGLSLRAGEGRRRREGLKRRKAADITPSRSAGDSEAIAFRTSKTLFSLVGRTLGTFWGRLMCQ